MGYEKQVVLDIETVACADAAQYLEAVEAPSNYKDPLKIAAYIADAKLRQVERAGLEADLCEVAAVGIGHNVQDEPQGAVVWTRVNTSERDMLRLTWAAVEGCSIIGFRTLSFDLPILIRRSQYLGVPYPDLNLDRYRTSHIDLAERLSFNGKLTMRSLEFYCRRFGIPCADTTTGADVAQMVTEDRWADVAAHCGCDICKTAALARRLGFLRQPVVEAEMVL